MVDGIVAQEHFRGQVVAVGWVEILKTERFQGLERVGDEVDYCQNQYRNTDE